MVGIRVEIGDKFITRTVLARVTEKGARTSRFKVLCDCGHEYEIAGGDLKSGKGCRKCAPYGRPTKILHAIGDRRHDLTLIRIIGHKTEETGHKKCYYEVQCNCGETFEITKQSFGRQVGCVKCGNIRTGLSKITHGATRKSGSIRTPLYKTWRSMLGRCKPGHQHTKHYAEKGIRVCDEWLTDFTSFRDWALTNGWAEGLTIDRKHTDKNYSPDNCRWITRSYNSKRLTSIRVNGIDPLLAAAQEWLAARRAVRGAGSLCPRIIKTRLRKAEMTLEEAIPFWDQ